MGFKEKYRKMNEQIAPDQALLEELLQKAGEQKERKEHPGRYWGRYLGGKFLKVSAAAAVVCLCACITLPVMASNPVIYQLMHLVSPGLAQRFVPVQMWDEDQGIRMEVVSASIQGNVAQVYITMQDLEGDRIDATTDLYDSYHIWTNADSSIGHCEKVGFDEETGIVTYLITITDDKEIGTGKVTFSVREFIGQKEYYEDIEIPIPLTEAEEDPQTMTATLSGVGGLHWRDYVDFNEHEAKVLVPGQGDERFPVVGMELTGLGYVDGMLHIQQAAPDNLENDNHGFFRVVDSRGGRRDSDYSLHFWGATEETETVAYTDEVFAISPEELPEYSLRGDFWVSGIHVEGKWMVTFSLGE
ncbi:MAG: hypothetical protein NC420_07640 [Eubacterium sp.]|nr:hypothetical protein [Eubacterium sp.]